MIPRNIVDILEGISIAILVISYQYGDGMTTLRWYEEIDSEEDTAHKYSYFRVMCPITWTLTKLAYLDRIPQDTVT